MLALLACGGRSTERQEANPSPPKPVAPGPSGKGGGGNSASAGTANQKPVMPEPSAGGAENTASGGADSTEPCAGVEPVCAPGEPVCDPLLGVSAGCDECGALQPAADAKRCARLLASDKERNLVCVVMGATDLQCWSTWGDAVSRKVPAETREVLLNDNGAYTPSYPWYPCVRTGSDQYSCFPGTAGISRVAVGDYGSCAISDGTLLCLGGAGPGVPPKPAIDVDISDATVFTLGGAGFAPGDWKPRLPDFWQGTPRSLRVDHQSAGCMVSTLDEMACWADVSQPFVRSAWTGFRKWLPMTLPRACVLDAKGRMGCGDILQDPAPAFFDTTNVVDIVASSSLACALTREGHVHCWNADGKPLELPADW